MRTIIRYLLLGCLTVQQISFAQGQRYDIYYAVDKMDTYDPNFATGSINGGARSTTLSLLTRFDSTLSLSYADPLVSGGYRNNYFPPNFFEYSHTYTQSGFGFLDEYQKTQTKSQIYRTAGKYFDYTFVPSLYLYYEAWDENRSCSSLQELQLTDGMPHSFSFENPSIGNCSPNGTNYKFQGTLAIVPWEKTVPTLIAPLGIDPLKVSAREVTLRAPEFMAQYFKPEEIVWIKGSPFGEKEGIIGIEKVIAKGDTLGFGRELKVTYNDPDTKWGEANCSKRKYYAYVPKCQWLSDPIEVQFTPNLTLGKDVIISQPICNESQSRGDNTRYDAFFMLGSTSYNRVFNVNVLDSNNIELGKKQLDKITPIQELSLDGKKYNLKFQENLGLDGSGGTVYSCPQTFSNITITPPKAISLKDSTFNDILCFSDRPSIDLNIDGNTTNYTLSYGDSSKSLPKGQTQNIALMKGTKSYDFTITDENGCIYEKPLSYKATEPAKLEASLSITNALCFDQNATIQLSAKGGTAFSPENPYRYTFTSNAGAQTEPLRQIKAGTLIQPKVLDQKNCTVQFKDSILYNPADFKLRVVQQKNNACPKGTNASVQLSGSSTDKRYFYTYAKDAKTYRADSLFAGLPSGTSTFQVQNQFGCLRDTTVTFTEPPYISISKTAVDSVTCAGESNGAITLNITGGTGFKRFWKDKGTAYLPPNKPYTFSYAYDSLPDQNYWFHAQDSLGCRDSVVYNIGTRSTIKHLLTAFAPSCDESKDGQLRVSNTGGIGAYQNEWLAPQGLDKHLVQTGLPKGTYILKSSDALACIKIDTFILTAPVALKVDLQGYPLICKGQSIDLDAGIVVPKYEWTSTKGFMANTKVVRLYDAGTYMLKVTDGLGCTGRDTFVLKQSDTEFKADFWVATTVVQGDTVVLVNNNAEIDNLVWVLNPSNTQRLPQLPDFRLQEVVFLEKGEQEVQMTGYYKGCRDILKKKILVVDPSERLKYDQAIGIKTSIIKTCGLFPNPNDGSFSLHLELNEANVPVALLLSSTTTGSLLKQLDWKIYPEGKIDFTEDLPEGPYVLHVKVRDEVVALRFLVAYD